MVISKKDKRRGGRTEPALTIPKKIAIEEGLDKNTFWDDWNDWRDGMRDLTDRSLIRPLTPIQRYWTKVFNIRKDNAKHKRHERIRTAQKRIMKKKK